MKSMLPLFAAMFLSVAVATPVFAHRLDEYLQATTFAVDGDHVEIQMHLTPGIEVFGKVLAAIHTNGDGIISDAKQQGYAEQVSSDLSLKINGNPLLLRLVSFTFPQLEEMK
jgi:hypothetical protein